MPEPALVGVEWLIDAYGCQPDRLRDEQRLRELLARVLRELELRVVGEPQWHQFGGAAGVTGLYLLSESHLACHTYPEHGLATFNLYCCRARPEWAWRQALAEALGATRVELWSFPRGGA